MKLTPALATLACAASLSANAGVGVDLDAFSAYAWRNAVQNDEMVLQPCAWIEIDRFEPLTLGLSVWQNYDLTANRRRGGLRHALTETDCNVHAGCRLWAAENEAVSLTAELGHDWFVNQGVRRADKSATPDTRELYARLTFSNPLADVYGQASWMYDDFGDYRKGVHLELGFTREQELTDVLSVGADWNVNFGDGRYLYYLYGGSSSGRYVDDEGDVADDYDTKETGFGGTTFKVFSTWRITDWLSARATLAYTGLLNGRLRDATKEQGAAYDLNGEKYPRDLLWGGLSVSVEF